MTKDIILEAVTRLHEASYQVVEITSDLGNKGVWKQLGITVSKTYFMHPLLKYVKVFFFPIFHICLTYCGIGWSMKAFNYQDVIAHLPVMFYNSLLISVQWVICG